jgi:hypothetical protein
MSGMFGVRSALERIPERVIEKIIHSGGRFDKLQSVIGMDAGETRFVK